jgi:hypothetical protein
MNVTKKLIRGHFAPQVLATLLLLGAAPLAHAKGPLSDLPPPPSDWRPIPCEAVQACGNTTTYSSCDYWPDIVGSPESGARQFLTTFGQALRLDEAKLRNMKVKPGLTSINLRFEQVYENRRVFGTEVVVISDKDSRIRKLRTSYFPIERILGNRVPTVSAKAAETVGRAAIARKPAGALSEPQLRRPTRSELVWFPVAGTDVALLAWELIIFGQTPFLGNYLTLVDANSGVLLHQENQLVMSK